MVLRDVKFLQLTPEDEERRRRRRERNKIAATKCRLKKREKTVTLVQESEILETQNHDLKSQIQELETQRRRLVDMLSLHGPTCLKQGGTDTSYQQFAEPLQLPSYQENFVQPPPALNQPQNCVTEYPVKVEEYEGDFYRQESPFVPTSNAGCTVQQLYRRSKNVYRAIFRSSPREDSVYRLTNMVRCSVKNLGSSNDERTVVCIPRRRKKAEIPMSVSGNVVLKTIQEF